MKSYTAKKPDKHGIIPFTDIENETWSILIERQDKIIKNRACQDYIDGLNKLNLPRKYIPQCKDINSTLLDLTGWSIFPVPALIPVKEFYSLLANRRFPAASFIRTPEDLDYLTEPDIFHEIYGHTPLLTNQAYADFMQWYGKIALQASPTDARILSRLFWFTIEFGLIKQDDEFRIYGGGILSSKQETIYAVESDIPQRVALDPLLALRSPYRYDIIQSLYFYINTLEDLYQLQELDLLSLVQQAKKTGNLIQNQNFC